MRVSKLIEELKKCPQDAVVVLHDTFMLGNEVLFVSHAWEKDNIIVLEREYDVDMYHYLDSVLKLGDSDSVKHTVYSTFVEMGIVPSTLERYLGVECAEHMKEYCDSHGIDYRR